VVRVDFTGPGESQGDFPDTNFSSNVDNPVAAADQMNRQLAAPQLLIGHSLGGLLCRKPQHGFPETVRRISQTAARLT
jgi:pimeloyl-ACP methyl ester carboxylesterase